MLFNSTEFIFMFLPITLMFYWGLLRVGKQEYALGILVIASWFFYAWWNPVYLALLLVSILLNYSIGYFLVQQQSHLMRKRVLVTGILINLGLLGYFKYYHFFMSTLSAIASTTFHLEAIILPLAISFFTFQQIAYLMDAYEGKTKKYHFTHYCLFVSFFPQLIAGPIVHHKEMLPQFSKLSYHKWDEALSIGTATFLMGLAKKMLIADSLAPTADRIFDSVSISNLSFIEAWTGALAYTFQLYFDFSGYSDMAIGLSRMFGIILPLNFFSPYKATSIIEFWRRWHMTLSRFLKDYLYIPLGGNRKGSFRRYVNLMITMVLGGLWHGAGWNFVIWGGLHGGYLVINHWWRHYFSHYMSHIMGYRFVSGAFTFLAVTIAWVFFRSPSVGHALNILKGMGGGHGIILPINYSAYFQYFGIEAIVLWFGAVYGSMPLYRGSSEIFFLMQMVPIVWLMPNVTQWVQAYEGRSEVIEEHFLFRWIPSLKWSPSAIWAAVMSILFLTTISFLGRESEFLYFQF